MAAAHSLILILSWEPLDEPNSDFAALSHFGIEQDSRNYHNVLLLYRLNRCQWFCHLGSSKLASAPKEIVS